MRASVGEDGVYAAFVVVVIVGVVAWMFAEAPVVFDGFHMGFDAVEVEAGGVVGDVLAVAGVAVEGVGLGVLVEGVAVVEVGPLKVVDVAGVEPELVVDAGGVLV